jgi:hypothetical protein
MSTLRDTSLIIQMSPLDPAMDATPQEFADEMLTRMIIKSTSDYYNVVRQDSAPLTDQGVLLLGGTSWYVWDENTASYQPFNVAPSMGIEVAGKWVLVSESGVMKWVTDATFASFITFGASMIPAGSDHQVLASLSGSSGWHNLLDIVPDGTVPVTKLLTTGATSGAVLTNASGTPTWTVQTPVTMHTSATFDIPIGGAASNVANPASSKTAIVRVVAVCLKSGQATTDGYAVGDEIDITGIFSDIVASDGGVKAPAYTVTVTAATITVASLPSPDGMGYAKKGGGQSDDFDTGALDGSWGHLKAYVLA